MAVDEIVIKLTYENGGHFRMTSKGGNGDEALTVCHVQENGHIADLWSSVQKICMTYFDAKMSEIGKEMKKPSEGGE